MHYHRWDFDEFGASSTQNHRIDVPKSRRPWADVDEHDLEFATGHGELVGMGVMEVPTFGYAVIGGTLIDVIGDNQSFLFDPRTAPQFNHIATTVEVRA